MAENPQTTSASANSILEYLLRQPLPSELLHPIIAVLPVGPPISGPLRRALLLRVVASDPLSLPSLSSLELLHHMAGPTTPALIRSAYLHAAVGSTLMPLLRSGDLPAFLDLVQRTWTMRVGDLLASPEAEAAGLASEDLVRWKARMEAAAEREEVREEILRGWTPEEGLGKVREFLVVELEGAGPTLLEREAMAMLVGPCSRRIDSCTCIYDEDDGDDDDDDDSGGDEEGNAGLVEQEAEICEGSGIGEERNGGGEVIGTDGGDQNAKEEERGQAGVGLKGIDEYNCIVNEEAEISFSLNAVEEMNDGEVVEQKGTGVSLNGIDGGDCIVDEDAGTMSGLGTATREERNGGQAEQGEVDLSSNGIDDATILVGGRVH